MKNPITFTCMGVNHISYKCETLAEAKEVLVKHPRTEQIEIRSSLKSYGMFDYRIISESNANYKCTLKINYLTAPKEQITIEMPIELLLNTNLFTRKQREVDSTELHYFGGMLVDKIRIPVYAWAYPLENVVMSSKYHYLLNNETGNKIIADIIKGE